MKNLCHFLHFFNILPFFDNFLQNLYNFIIVFVQNCFYFYEICAKLALFDKRGTLSFKKNGEKLGVTK